MVPSTWSCFFLGFWPSVTLGLHSIRQEEEALPPFIEGACPGDRENCRLKTGAAPALSHSRLYILTENQAIGLDIKPYCTGNHKCLVVMFAPPSQDKGSLITKLKHARAISSGYPKNVEWGDLDDKVGANLWFNHDGSWCVVTPAGGIYNTDRSHSSVQQGGGLLYDDKKTTDFTAPTGGTVRGFFFVKSTGVNDEKQFVSYKDLSDQNTDCAEDEIMEFNKEGSVKCVQEAA